MVALTLPLLGLTGCTDTDDECDAAGTTTITLVAAQQQLVAGKGGGRRSSRRTTTKPTEPRVPRQQAGLKANNEPARAAA